MKQLVLATLCLSSLALVAVSNEGKAKASALKDENKIEMVSNVNTPIDSTTMWKKITGLFVSPGFADQLAPGVTQETINTLKEEVELNISEKSVKTGMFSVIQQAQDLLGTETPVKPVDPIDSTTMWKKITGLFVSPGFADQLAPGVTQETINILKEEVELNISEKSVKTGMFSVLQQAQDLL